MQWLSGLWTSGGGQPAKDVHKYRMGSGVLVGRQAIGGGGDQVADGSYDLLAQWADRTSWSAILCSLVGGHTGGTKPASLRRWKDKQPTPGERRMLRTMNDMGHSSADRIVYQETWTWGSMMLERCNQRKISDVRALASPT